VATAPSQVKNYVYVLAHEIFQKHFSFPGKGDSVSNELEKSLAAQAVTCRDVQ
jgi:hypothetical protein